MKKIMIMLILVCSLFFLYGCTNIQNLNPSKCDIKTTSETPVSLELAKAFATKQVHENNRPYNWSYVGNYEIFDSYGKKTYYLIIFRKSELNAFDTLDKLEQNALAQKDDEQKYQFNNIATVMTSSMKEVKPLQRHYRGIPEPAAKKLEIEKEFGKVSNLITDSPMGNFYFEISNGNAIKIYDNTVMSISELKKASEEIQKRKDSQYANLNEGDCKRYQEAITEAEQAHMIEWNSYE
jgi:hypothetical protein